jgi:hypothetical protein
MLRAYVNILAFVLGLSNFVVLAWTTGSGNFPAARDFLIPAAELVLLVSLVFLVLKLVRQHDARIIARALAQRGAQVAEFKAALRNPSAGRPDFFERI